MKRILEDVPLDVLLSEIVLRDQQAIRQFYLELCSTEELKSIIQDREKKMNEQNYVYANDYQSKENQEPLLHGKIKIDAKQRSLNQLANTAYRFRLITKSLYQKIMDKKTASCRFHPYLAHKLCEKFPQQYYISGTSVPFKHYHRNMQEKLKGYYDYYDPNQIYDDLQGLENYNFFNIKNNQIEDVNNSGVSQYENGSDDNFIDDQNNNQEESFYVDKDLEQIEQKIQNLRKAQKLNKKNGNKKEKITKKLLKKNKQRNIILQEVKNPEQEQKIQSTTIKRRKKFTIDDEDDIFNHKNISDDEDEDTYLKKKGKKYRKLYYDQEQEELK